MEKTKKIKHDEPHIRRIRGRTLSPWHREECPLSRTRRNYIMTLKQRARTGLEAGPSTVTEFQHPAGSPECRQAIGRRDVHSPAQCRHACSSERPTSGATDEPADPKCMPSYGFLGHYLPIRRRGYEGVATPPPCTRWVRYDFEFSAT